MNASGGEREERQREGGNDIGEYQTLWGQVFTQAV